MPRPAGPLVWLHADAPPRVPALRALAERMAREDGTAALLTLPPEAPLPEAVAESRIPVRHAPPERLGPVRAFLDHWRPDLLVWAGGALRPVLLAATRAPRLLVDGAPDGALLAEGGWIPGLARATAPLFDRALVTDEAALARLARAGLARERIEVVPPFEPPAAVPPCNERERRDLAGTIGARPLWLAGEVPAAELPVVAAAHHVASRSAHRLLLILAPRAPEDADAMAAALADAGLKVASRADGAEPDAETQVYLADGPAEMGLWLRLAPLSYAGGTLSCAGGRDPFEAAALGSALLHGPHVAPHDARWARLDAAGAARLVRDGPGLGAAVEALLAPDRAAAVAAAAWDVATRGAETSNRLLDLARERLPEHA